jgi:hypothetical protein
MNFDCKRQGKEKLETERMKEGRKEGRKEGSYCSVSFNGSLLTSHH